MATENTTNVPAVTENNPPAVAENTRKDISPEQIEENLRNMDEDDRGNVQFLLTVAGSPKSYYEEHGGTYDIPNIPSGEIYNDYERKPFEQNGWYDFWDGFYNTAIVGTGNGLANLIPTTAQFFGIESQFLTDWQNGADKFFDQFVAKTSEEGSFWADLGSGFGFVAPLLITRGAGASRIARFGGKNSRLAKWMGNSKAGQAVEGISKVNPLNITGNLSKLSKGIGKTKVGKAANKVMGDKLTLALSTTMMYNDLRKEAKELGMSDTDAARVSMLTAGLIGLTENLATERIYQAVSKPVLKKIASKSMQNAIRAYGNTVTSADKLKLYGKGIQASMLPRLKSAIGQFGEGYVTEGIQEFSQTYAEDLIKKTYEQLVLGTDDMYGSYDETFSREKFDEALYSGYVGGWVGGPMQGTGAFIHGKNEEMLYGYISRAAKKNNQKNIDKILAGVNEQVKNGELTQEQADVMREEIADMTENAKQAHAVGIKDEVAHYQLWQLRQAQKIVEEQVGFDEAVFNENNKLAVSKSMSNAFAQNKKQAKKLTDVIEQKSNEIIESGKRETSNPEKFNELISDIDDVFTMISEREDPNKINEAITKLSRKHVRPERVEQVVEGVEHKEVETKTESKPSFTKEQQGKINAKQRQIDTYKKNLEKAEKENDDKGVEKWSKKVEAKEQELTDLKESFQKEAEEKQEAPKTPEESKGDEAQIETEKEVEEELPEGFRYVEEGEVLPAGDYETRLSMDGKRSITNAPRTPQPSKEYKSKNEPTIVSKKNGVEYTEPDGSKYRVQDGKVYDAQNNRITGTKKGKEVLLRVAENDGTLQKKTLTDPKTGKSREFLGTPDGKVFVKNGSDVNEIKNPDIKRQFNELEGGRTESTVEDVESQPSSPSSAKKTSKKKRTLERKHLPKKVGSSVKYKGQTYTVVDEGAGKYSLENQDNVIEVTDEVLADVKPILGYHKVKNVTDDSVTVNDVDYTINTDEKGNVVSLSPTNKPTQEITNESMLVSVEIERNKQEYQNQEVPTDEQFEETLEEDPSQSRVANMVYMPNMNETVDTAIDKLLNNEELSKSEQVALDQWVVDALFRAEKLYKSDPNNQAYADALDNLEGIQYELYTKYEAEKVSRQREEVGDVVEEQTITKPKPSKREGSIYGKQLDLFESEEVEVTSEVEEETTEAQDVTEEELYEIADNEEDFDEWLENSDYDLDIDDDLDTDDDVHEKKSRFNNNPRTNNPGTELTFSQITDYFQSIFPNISASQVKRLTDKFGNRVLGKITKLGIEVDANNENQIPLIHEYAHAYILAKGGHNNPLIRQGLEMIKETPYFAEAQRLYPELSINEQAEEALAQAIAETSYEKLKAKMNNQSLLDRFVRFAKRFWTSVKSLFTKSKAPQIIDIISNDMLNPKTSYDTDLGSVMVGEKYRRDSALDELRSFTNDQVIHKLVRIMKGEVKEANQTKAKVAGHVRKAIHKEYRSRNKTDNMFTGIELEYDVDRIDEIKKILDKEGDPKEIKKEYTREYAKYMKEFFDALRNEQPQMYNAYKKAMEHFGKTPTVKIEQNLEDKSSKANIKNDRKLSPTYQAIISNLLDKNGDPISKSKINEYLAHVSQKSPSFIHLKKKLKADRETNELAARLDDIITNLGDGFSNPIAQQFNSIYIDRVVKSLVGPEGVSAITINKSHEIREQSKKIQDNLRAKNYKVGKDTRPGKEFFYRSKKKALGKRISTNFWHDFANNPNVSSATETGFMEIDVINKKGNEYYKDRFFETMKKVTNMELDRSTFDEWMEIDAPSDLNLLPSVLAHNAMGEGKFADWSVEYVIGKLIARQEGGDSLVAQYISVTGNNENAIRPGAFMDRFNTQYLYDEDFQKRVDNSDYMGGYILDHIKANEQVTFAQLDGVENMNTGQVKQYTDQTMVDTVMRDLSYYTQDGRTYLQNTGVNGRGRTTAMALPKRTSAQLEQDYKYQAELDEKILNEYIEENGITDREAFRENYSKVSFNELRFENGKVKVISPFEKGYKGDFDARLDEIVNMFTDEEGNFQMKFKENIINTIEIKDAKGKILETIDTDKDIVKHFIKNDHIARHHIANIYSGAMAQKITESETKPMDADFIKRFGGATSTGEQEYIDKPIKYVVFEVPNPDTREGAEKNLSDSMSIIGRSLYERMLENHGNIGGIGLNMKNVVYQVNPDTGKQLFIKKSSIAAMDLSQFDQHENGKVLPDSGVVTWTNIQEMVDAVDKFYKEQGVYVEFIDGSSVKGQDLGNVQSINLSDTKFWEGNNLNETALLEAVEGQDSTRDIYNMSTTFDINSDYSAKDIEEIVATASTQLISIAQDGVGVEGGPTRAEVLAFQQAFVDKFKSDMGVEGDDYMNSRVVRELMNNTALLKKVRQNAIESDNEVIEDLTTKILDRQAMTDKPAKIKDRILSGKPVRKDIDNLKRSFERANDEKGSSLISKLEEELREKEDPTQTLADLEAHATTIGTIDKFDWPSLKGLVEGTISKTLSNSGLKMKLPGAYLHAIPDYGKNLQWYPREGEAEMMENGYLNPDHIPTVAVPWSMYANSLEEANELKDRLEAEGKYLRLNDVRVPASDNVSKFTAKVAYFTDGTANTVVVPTEFIEASDSDHDGDKLFLYREPVKYVNGKVELDTESFDYNAFESMHKLMNKPYAIKGTRKNLKLDSLHKAADYIKATKGQKDSLSKGIRDTASMNEIGSRLSFSSDAIGIFALVGKQHNMLLRNGVKLKDAKGGDMKIFIPTKIGQDPIEVNSFTASQKDEIAKLLQASLDVVKDPVFVELGITPHNIGVAKTMLMLGVDLQTTLEFINNDVLTSVIEEVDNKTNIYTGEKESFFRKFKEIKDKYAGKKHPTFKIDPKAVSELITNQSTEIYLDTHLELGKTYKHDGSGNYIFYKPVSVEKMTNGKWKYELEEVKLDTETTFNKEVLDTFHQLNTLSANLDKLLSVIRLDGGLPNNQDGYVKIMDDIGELNNNAYLGYDYADIMAEPLVKHNIAMASTNHQVMSDKLLAWNPAFIKTVKDFNNDPKTPNVKFHRAFESVVNSFAQKNSDSDMINLDPKEGERQIIADIEIIESLIQGKGQTEKTVRFDESDFKYLEQGKDDAGVRRDINSVKKIIEDPGFVPGLPLEQQEELTKPKNIEKVNNEKELKVLGKYVDMYNRRLLASKTYGKYADNLFLKSIQVVERKDGHKIIKPNPKYYNLPKETKLEIVEAYKDLKKDRPELASRLEAYQLLRLGVTDKRGSLINLMGMDMSMDVLSSISNVAKGYIINNSETVKMNMMLDVMALKNPKSKFERDGFYKSATMKKYNTTPEKSTKDYIDKMKEELTKKCSIA